MIIICFLTKSTTKEEEEEVIGVIVECTHTTRTTYYSLPSL